MLDGCAVDMVCVIDDAIVAVLHCREELLCMMLCDGSFFDADCASIVAEIIVSDGTVLVVRIEDVARIDGGSRRDDDAQLLRNLCQ